MIYVVVPPGRNRPVFMRKKSSTTTKPSSDPSSSSSSPRLGHPTKKEPEPPMRPSKGQLVMSIRSRKAFPGKRNVTRTETRKVEAPSSMVAVAGNSVSAEGSDFGRISRGYRLIRKPHSLYMYVCGICGTYRSRDYHSRHPLAPGEVPKPTICTRCAQELESDTDYSESEDTSVPRSNASRIISDDSGESIIVSVDETTSSERYLRPLSRASVDQSAKSYRDRKQLQIEYSGDSIPRKENEYLNQASGPDEPSRAYNPTHHDDTSRSWSDRSDEVWEHHAPRAPKSSARSRVYRGSYEDARKTRSTSTKLPSSKSRVFVDGHNRANKGLQEHEYTPYAQTSRSATESYRESRVPRRASRDQEQPYHERYISYSQEKRRSQDPPTNRVRILSIGPASSHSQDYEQQSHSASRPSRHHKRPSSHFDDPPTSRHATREYVDVEGHYEYIEDPRVPGSRAFIDDFVRKNTASRRGCGDERETASLEAKYGGYDGW